MRHLATILVTALCAAPLWASDLQQRFEAMGTLEATVGDSEHEMVIAYDREKDRPYAEQKVLMGRYLTINLVGQTVDEKGRPGSPMIQVTLQEQTGEMGLISVEMFDEQGFDAPLSMGPDGGPGELTEYSLEGDALDGAVTGEFRRLTDYMGDPKIAEGSAPVPATIRFRVTLPPLEE